MPAKWNNLLRPPRRRARLLCARPRDHLVSTSFAGLHRTIRRATFALSLGAIFLLPAQRFNPKFAHGLHEFLVLAPPAVGNPQ